MATAELVAVCDGLPLALRVAAAHLATRPSLPIATYVTELRAVELLPALAVDGDEQSTVANAIAASHRLVGKDSRGLLKLLARTPDGSLTAAVAAKLAGIPVTAAAPGLDQLADVGLLDRCDVAGYRLRGLVRAFVVQYAETQLQQVG